MKTIVIIGASGDVGAAATDALMRAGHSVVAISRGIRQLSAQHAQNLKSERFHLVEGSMENEASAATLLEKVRQTVNRIDAVLASINVSPHRPETLLEWNSAALLRTLQDNLITHFVAAKTFIPAIADGGLYLGIGGGMADKLFPYYGYNSMIQSALRMMFRYLDHENRNRRIEVRELIISAMVTTEEKANSGERKFNWISNRQVGEHIAAIIKAPAAFAGPIQLLNSSHGVGRSLSMELIPPPPPSRQANV
jgi:NAD(P)-dependent dehydrogenase (short-subunit alcohol dehydrogenase family)